MNKVKTFAQNHKTAILTGVAVGTLTFVTAIVMMKYVGLKSIVDNSIELVSHPDGSFTVKDALVK